MASQDLSEMHDATWPPGTVALEDIQNLAQGVILQPPPTEDPNDPLNWSKPRKALNFFLASLYSLFTFVLLDIGTVIWGPLNTELGISYSNLNNSFATNCAGLAVGCIFIIPFAYKYGRRPVYLLSLIVQLASAIWMAKMKTTWEVLVVNIVAGLGGAVSETIVQMTVKDLFFVHQRATMNGLYLSMVIVGTFLAPVPAGYAAISQGWPWIWWWTAILLGITLVAFVFFFEETKYVPVLNGRSRSVSLGAEVDTKQVEESGRKEPSASETSQVDQVPERRQRSYRQRMALSHKTDAPIVRHFWQPFLVLVTFPAVAYTAICYGALLAWFSVLATTQSTYLLSPPYNFQATGVGLFSIAPFIGAVIGCVIGGPLNDWWILFMSKRNNGIFEPEYRLYLAIPTIILSPIGILTFGLGLAKGLPWIVLAVGSALYGLALTILSDVTLTYVTDCYQDIVGDALVAVTFVRNTLATIIVFALTPWINAIGLYNMFVCVACLSVAVNLLTIPMLIYGKRARAMTATKYRQMAMLQPDHRSFL